MSAPKPKALEPDEAVYDLLATEFPAYAECSLKIRPKEGGDEDFILNRVQHHLDEIAERQLRARGFVRIIILKGRQQGCTTYVEGRGYWKTTHRKGYRTFILTHEDQATQNVFGMVKHFHDNCPDDLRPETGAANANELHFPRLNSGYKIGTAGGKDPGRSQTVQFFHGSEVAFWPNAQKHARGVLQTVPKAHDTEVWLESTSDGPGNYFHQMCMDAIAGKSDYEFVFIPWWWQDEYTADDSAFTPADDEKALLDAYGEDGLTASHLAWRRTKVSELGGIEAFKREYPNSAEEAFEVAAHDKLIDPLKIKATMKRDVLATLVRPIWGADCGRFGDDLSTLAKRQGNVLLEKIKHWGKSDTMQSAGRIVNEFKETPDEDRPSHIIVDAIGIGAGVADRLREVFKEEGWDTGDYPCKIVDVNFGEAPSEKERFSKCRDEMWWEMKEWSEALDSSMPEDAALEQDLTAPTFTYLSSGKVQVEPKPEFKKRLKRSPDRADALANTFYVRPQPRAKKKPKTSGAVPQGGSWASL